MAGEGAENLFRALPAVTGLLGQDAVEKIRSPVAVSCAQGRQGVEGLAPFPHPHFAVEGQFGQQLRAVFALVTAQEEQPVTWTAVALAGVSAVRAAVRHAAFVRGLRTVRAAARTGTGSRR